MCLGTSVRSICRRTTRQSYLGVSERSLRPWQRCHEADVLGALTASREGRTVSLGICIDTGRSRVSRPTINILLGHVVATSVHEIQPRLSRSVGGRIIAFQE